MKNTPMLRHRVPGPRRAPWLVPILCCLGCGERSPYVPVRGSVAYRGQPVEHALVVFNGKGDLGRAATGYTDADGRFELTTYVSSKITAVGAVPNDYSVFIEKRDPPHAPELQPGARKARDIPQDGSVSFKDIYQQVVDGKLDPGGGGIMVPGKSRVPERYSNPETPAIHVAVERGGANEFQFDLED